MDLFRIADGRLFNLNRISTVMPQPDGSARVYLRGTTDAPFDVKAEDAHLLKPGRLVRAARGATAVDAATGQSREVLFFRVTDVAIPIFAG